LETPVSQMPEAFDFSFNYFEVSTPEIQEFHHFSNSGILKT